VLRAGFLQFGADWDCSVAGVGQLAGMKRTVLLSIICAPMLLPVQPIAAHGGGLAADGCHNDRKNGGRHCHGGSSRSLGSGRALGLRASGGGGPYANCSAARAAGAAPVHRGEAGYGSHLDRDNDGVGCE
jgi:hypothetical protein